MNDKKTNDPTPELSDEALENVAGGIIGTDHDGDGMIDEGCTDLRKPYSPQW